MAGLHSKFETVPNKRSTFQMTVGEIVRENGGVYLVKCEAGCSRATEILGKYYLSVSEEDVRAQGIKVGDRVEYESLAMNSGYFVRKVGGEDE